MSNVDEFAPKVLSGIDVVDRTWGGLFRGGCYLIYGRVSNGRGLAALMFAQTGVENEEKTLFVSGERSKDLVIQAAATGFDVRKAHRQDEFKLIRVPQLLGTASVRSGSSSPLKVLTEQVRAYQPDRLVVNGLASFMHYGEESSFSRFQVEFEHFLDEMDPIGTTIMLLLPEPANDAARDLTRFVMSRSTAAIFVGRDQRGGSDETAYELTLIPQIGHITRKKTVRWPLQELVGTAENVEQTYLALRSGLLGKGEQSVLPERRSDVSDVRDTERVLVVEPTATPVETIHAQTLDEIARGLDDDEPKDSVVERVLEEVLEPLRSGTPQTSEVRQQPTEPDTNTVEETHRHIGRVVGRGRFEASLQHYYEKLRRDGSSFLLLAMRLTDRNDQAGPFDFEYLAGVVRDLLRPNDELLVDLAKTRLVLLLPESSADNAQDLFARAKARLRHETPMQSEKLLQMVSAIVVPNGNPFSNAQEFLAYVLDND